MNKILIIKPKYKTFPVGIAYVLACLEQKHISFDFIDIDLQPDYVKLLKNNDYCAVATGGLIGHYKFFCEVIANVRKFNPKVPVILGGNIVKDIRSDFLLDKIGADYGIIGEGETSLPGLIDKIMRQADTFSDISGLVYRDKLTANIVKTVPRRLNLKSTNIMPAWHRIDVDYYSRDWSMPFWGVRSAMPVLSGRGCVGRCTFCSPTIGSFRARPIEHVIQEIEWLNYSYEFDWVVFLNEMFYPSKDKILEFCEAYKKVKQRKPWACSLRVDANADVETFMAMKESGCIGISTGIESGSDKILKLMRKRSTNEAIVNCFRNAREAGLSCSGTFMVGNEGETLDDLRQTIDMVTSEEMNTGESLANAYPGTQIYANALNRGKIKDEWDYLEKMRFACGLWEDEWTDRSNYLNISEIPDDQFWATLACELRRYNTFLLNRYEAKDAECEEALFGTMVKVKGFCRECGAGVTVKTRRRMLGIEGYCRECMNKVVFNLYKTKGFAGHHELIVRMIRESNRIVVSGTGFEAASLMRMDYFGLDYDKLKGFLQIDSRNSMLSFIGMPCLGFDDLASVKPDMVLIADDALNDAELLLRSYYAKKGLVCPKIVQLTPNKAKSVARLIQGISKREERRPSKISYLIYQTLIVPARIDSSLKINLWNALRFMYHQTKRFNALYRLVRDVSNRI
jgi:anaerobic magnesium-protoporphyrin IX monomethyl ester cyclase